MDCADYRIDCDGDSDGNGNDLMHGVLKKGEAPLSDASLIDHENDGVIRGT